MGSCVEVWWIGEGVQRLCLPYYCHFFWLASLASLIQTYYIYTHFQVQCSLLNGHPFSNIPLIQIMKRIQLPISCFYERTFSYFSRLKLHDFTPFKSKILWGRTPRPPPFHDTFTISKTTMWYAWLCREALNYKKTIPLPKILNVNNFLESRFKPYFCRRERGKEQSKPCYLSSFFFFFFFLLVKNFWKVEPPPPQWRKFLDSRLSIIILQDVAKYITRIYMYLFCGDLIIQSYHLTTFSKTYKCKRSAYYI